jgi:hypothetical protein
MARFLLELLKVCGQGFRPFGRVNVEWVHLARVLLAPLGDPVTKEGGFFGWAAGFAHLGVWGLVHGCFLTASRHWRRVDRSAGFARSMRTPKTSIQRTSSGRWPRRRRSRVGMRS